MMEAAKRRDEKNSQANQSKLEDNNKSVRHAVLEMKRKEVKEKQELRLVKTTTATLHVHTDIFHILLHCNLLKALLSRFARDMRQAEVEMRRKQEEEARRKKLEKMVGFDMMLNALFGFQALTAMHL